MTDRDSVYATRRDLVDFAFDDSVATVFPDMIRRSVPGYDLVVPMSGLLASRHLEAGDRCYDLGCSLGATSLAVLERVGDLDIEIVAVDSSPAMLERARERVTDPRVRFVEADICDVPIDDAGAVIMNYTLQFVPLRDRATLLARIRGGVGARGCLVVSEKVETNDADVALHVEYNRANGYSELEISQKRQALENVMIPEPIDTHLQRFTHAGFSSARVWFRCLNWASFIATP